MDIDFPKPKISLRQAARGLLTEFDCRCAYWRAVSIFWELISEYPLKRLNQLRTIDCNEGSTMLQQRLVADTRVWNSFSVTVARRGKFKGKSRKFQLGMNAGTMYIPSFGATTKWIRFVRLHSVVAFTPKSDCTKWFSKEAFDFLEQSIYDYGKFENEFNLLVSYRDAGYYYVDSPPNDNKLLSGQSSPAVGTNMIEEAATGAVNELF